MHVPPWPALAPASAASGSFAADRGLLASVAVRGLPRTWPRPGPERRLLLLLLAVALVAHGVNMFDFAAATATDAEAVLTARAGALLHRLSTGAAWPDSAPAGPFVLALWLALVGGVLGAGHAVDSGRVLMLVVHLATVAMLYRAARRLGCAALTASLACLLLSLSPLAMYAQRLVLTDTLMLFWALASTSLALHARARPAWLALSGATLGLACLTRDTAVAFLPPLLLLVWQRLPGDRARGCATWLAPLLLLLSWYPLSAALQDGRATPGPAFAFVVRSWAGDALPWLGAGLPNLAQPTWQAALRDWLGRDPVLLVGGAVATGVNLARGLVSAQQRRHGALAVGLLALLPLLQLGRHGDDSVALALVAAIPFLCLAVAVAATPLAAHLNGRATAAVAIVAVSAAGAGYLDAGTLQPLYTQQPGLATREATSWIKRQVPAESRILAPEGLAWGLREDGPAGPAFPYAYSARQAAVDPAVRDGVFHGDWRTVDYLILTPGSQAALVAAGNTIATESLRNAHLVKQWHHDTGSIELWKVDRPGRTELALLAGGARSMQTRFEQAGAYLRSDGSVSSESQGYALLRDVWSGDRADFDRVWRWTRSHLLRDGGLPGWLWRDGAFVDPHTGAGADADLALALLMAGRRWHDPALVDDGTTLVRAMWQREVVTVAGTPHVTAGDWAAPPRTSLVAFSPGDFAPYAYRVFQEVDPGDDWSGVVDSGYRTLAALSRAPRAATGPSGLPPDWIGVDRANGALAELPVVGTADTTAYGWDGPRTYWRVALDRRWNGEPRAEAYLRSFAPDGAAAPSSMVGTAGALAALMTADPPAAHALFAAGVVARTISAEGDRPDGRPDVRADVRPGVRWDVGTDPDDQAWGWFATALYADQLPDLWHGLPDLWPQSPGLGHEATP